MKQIMDLQCLGYSSGASRNLGVRERWIVMDGEKGERDREGEREREAGVGVEKGSARDPWKRIRFVECQLEEGSLRHDLNTGSVILTSVQRLPPTPTLPSCRSFLLSLL